MFYSYSSFGNKIRFSYFFLGTAIISTLIFVGFDIPIDIEYFLLVVFLSFLCFFIIGGFIWCSFVSNLNNDTIEYTSEDYANYKDYSYYGFYYKRWHTLFGKKFACEDYQFFEKLFEQKKQQVINLDGKEVYIKDNKLYIR